MDRRTFGTGMIGLGVLLAQPALAGLRDSLSDDDPAQQLAKLEARSGCRLGVSALDTQSGYQLSHRAEERFALCSTFKVLAVAAVLARAARGDDDLTRMLHPRSADIVPYSPVVQARLNEGMTLEQLCEAAMVWGDNSAANLLLSTLGGPPGLTAYARTLGDGVTRLDRLETAVNEAVPGDDRDTSSPQAMQGNLKRLLLEDALPAPERERLKQWMLGCKTGDQRLRAGLPADWQLGHRTGAGGHGTCNDIGAAWRSGAGPVLMSVYLTESKAELADREQVIAEAARIIAHAAVQVRLRG